LCGLRLYMVNRKFLHSSLSMNFCDIAAYLLVRCSSSLWDDDAEFCHMMHVNCGFLWIWVLDLIYVNSVISWLVPGCSSGWLPNPGWIQDAAGKQAAGYCRDGQCICNGRYLKLITSTYHWVIGFNWNTRYKHANKVSGKYSWKNCHIPHGIGDRSQRKISCWWHCVGSDYVWWIGNFCIPPCPWIFVILLHTSLWNAFPPCEMMMLNFVIWCMWIVDFCEFGCWI
jgi:hypothetical protein